MILGIDVSTSITGFAIIDKTGYIIESSVSDLRKYKTFYSKCITIKEFIIDLSIKYKIDQIYIEEPFMFFNSGGSSARTMATLQRFNGVVSWMIFEIFEKLPEHITVAQARKLAGIKVPRGQKSKAVVLEHVRKTQKDFKVEMTRNGNPKPETYDRADAYVIAVAGLKKLNDR
tara:strand:- start:1765 stop:2283 length:519 start_codon:yes stop_codon:yes gene_type:complete